MRGRILVIDDEADMTRLIQRIIGEETEHDVVTTSDPVVALDTFRNEPFDLVITDLRMPNLTGLQVLENVKRIRPDTAVIILTAFATIETAVEAVRKGAFDYLTKPFERSRMVLTVEKAMAWQAMLRENAQLRNALAEEDDGVRFIGTSPVIQGILARARQVAPTTATVLITGPSGTGKDVLTSFIHQHGSRRERPLVTVNCSAIPETMLESELFGHVRGAFTGAIRDKRGLIEEADRATLFLDEIGDLGAPMQAKLLRLLQGGDYRPVGGLKTRCADIRVIAATNRDLKAAMLDRTFREDLFYRLNVVQFELPPLRERKSDIPLLAKHFLDAHARRLGKDVRDISPSAMQALMSYDCPGNTRELMNLLERGVIYCRGATLELRDLDLAGGDTWIPLPEHEGRLLPFREARKSVIGQFHRQYIASLLEETGGNISEAAKRAGIQRQYLHRLMKEAQIKAAGYREGDD